MLTPIPPKAAEYVSSSKAAKAWEMNSTPGDSALFEEEYIFSKSATKDELINKGDEHSLESVHEDSWVTPGVCDIVY